MTKFWKPILAVLLVCALALSGGAMLAKPAASAASETPASTAADLQAAPISAGEEFRAVWVATVYRLDYPSQATTDPAVLKRDADAILQECVELGMNAVILQVRPSADALYPSDYYPWSRYLTGTQGTAPRNGFDPLEYWVERAHALGLELHAWINPFRITKGGQTEFDSLTADHPARLHPDWVVEYEGEFYFNPGLPEVRAYIIQGAEELARSYDIDGVHLDDYFYPGSGFDDADTYAQYGAGFSDLGDWRRDNVNRLVEELGERLHAIDPNLSYGISPSGVWADRSSLPQGSNTTGGYESYYASYADSRKWVKEGWIDYICPQVYWYIGHSSMDYETIVRWWADTVEGTGVSLYIGMADYQAGNTSESSPWYGTRAIEAQLALNQYIPQVTGEVHFRYVFLAEGTALNDLYRRAYNQAGPEPTQTPEAEPTPVPTATPEPTPAPAAEVALDTVRHGVYIHGSDGLFPPPGPMGRAEGGGAAPRGYVKKGPVREGHAAPFLSREREPAGTPEGKPPAGPAGQAFAACASRTAARGASKRLRPSCAAMSASARWAFTELPAESSGGAKAATPMTPGTTPMMPPPTPVLAGSPVVKSQSPVCS